MLRNAAYIDVFSLRLILLRILIKLTSCFLHKELTHKYLNSVQITADNKQCSHQIDQTVELLFSHKALIPLCHFPQKHKDGPLCFATYKIPLLIHYHHYHFCTINSVKCCILATKVLRKNSVYLCFFFFFLESEHDFIWGIWTRFIKFMTWPRLITRPLRQINSGLIKNTATVFSWSWLFFSIAQDRALHSPGNCLFLESWQVCWIMRLLLKKVDDTY